MKQKKVIALLAVAAMTVGLFSGCGSGSGDEKKSGGKEKITTFGCPTFAATDAKVTDEEFWGEKMEAFGKENNCEVKVEIIRGIIMRRNI